MKSISENLEKDTVSIIKKSSTVIDFKKNKKLFILCSFKLSDFKDSNVIMISIKQFTRRKTSEFTSENNSNYNFSSVFINNTEIVHKFCICLFKIVSLIMMLNNLQKKIENNYYLVNKYNIKKEEIIHIFT